MNDWTFVLQQRESCAVKMEMKFYLLYIIFFDHIRVLRAQCVLTKVKRKAGILTAG